LAPINEDDIYYQDQTIKQSEINKTPLLEIRSKILAGWIKPEIPGKKKSLYSKSKTPFALGVRRNSVV